MTGDSLPTRPLVVDLDGTLLVGDVFQRQAAEVAFREPWQFAGILLGSGSKARVKERFATRVAYDPAHDAYRPEVLELISQYRKAGQQVFLATAAAQSVAEGVAEHLGVFDGVFSSTTETNLSRETKRDRLLEAFPGGFDYVGNESADLPVWEAATTGWVVGPQSGRLIQRRRGALLAVPASETPSLGKGVLRALRPHQWAKNLLIFLPLVASQNVTEWSMWAAGLWAVAAFSLAASGNYLINDIVDQRHDRAHPTKRTRPIASGALPPVIASLLALLLIASGMVTAWALSPAVGWTLATYLLVSYFYSMVFKRWDSIDTVVLAVLYGVRVVAGALAIGVSLSPWMISFTFFLFYSLAVGKRVAELLAVSEGDGQVNGRGYRPSDQRVLLPLGVGAGVASTLVLLLYLFSATADVQYGNPLILVVAVPVFLAWVAHFWMETSRGHMDQDPVVWALKSRQSFVLGVLFFAVFVVAQTLVGLGGV